MLQFADIFDDVAKNEEPRSGSSPRSGIHAPNVGALAEPSVDIDVDGDTEEEEESTQVLQSDSYDGVLARAVVLPAAGTPATKANVDDEEDELTELRDTSAPETLPRERAAESVAPSATRSVPPGKGSLPPVPGRSLRVQRMASPPARTIAIRKRAPDAVVSLVRAPSQRPPATAAALSFPKSASTLASASKASKASEAAKAEPTLESAAPAVPAHFQVPSRPDVPDVAASTSHRFGRPSLRWAAALLTGGLLVGLGAVAVVQYRHTIVASAASLVASAPAAAPQEAPRSPAPAAEAPPTAISFATPAVVPAASTPASATPTTAASSAAAPPVAAPSVAVAAPTASTLVASAAVVSTPAAASAPAAPTPKLAWRPAAAPAPKPVVVAKPAPPPAPKPVASEDTSTSKSAKKPAKNEADEETRKALEALHKAQLDSARAFGKD